LSSEEYPGTTGWKTMTVIATVAAPLFAVLWLGMALSLQSVTLSSALVKIIFAMVAVGAGILGTRWITASGVILGLQTLTALFWVLLRVGVRGPGSTLRTVLLLIVPLGISSVLLIFAGGIKAGTWPPARFSKTV
jgi:hypothetical protein